MLPNLACATPSNPHPVSNENVDYAWEVAKLRDRGVRADVDERNEKCSSRSVLLKHKDSLPIDRWGRREMEDGTVNAFVATDQKAQTVSIVDDFFCSSYPS